MTGRPLVPIQPKPRAPGGDDDPQPNKLRKIRSAILVACDPCRRLKTKCDGDRPECRKCLNRGIKCTYELPEDALSRTSARKELTSQLQRENLEFRQLFRDLSSRPEPEAYDIFKRLRLLDDPLALVHSIRQAELLLQPSTTRDRDEVTALQQLDSTALEGSSIKIPARPWTAVAGDGIVSELVSAWFKWDNTFLYPLIDRESFTRDVRGGDLDGANYCSPFLVNAICALRSYFSKTVDTWRHLTRHDLREQFLAEAKKTYDHEVPTIPTVQGLWIMFAISSMKGEDKSGSLYRLAAYGMLKKSRLNQVFFSLNDTDQDEALKKRTISRIVWGFFCLESITAANYRKSDALQEPVVPCLFPEFDYENPANVDLFGETFTESSQQPPVVVGAVNTFCQVANLMKTALEIDKGKGDNEKIDVDDLADFQSRITVLGELHSISDSLPSKLRHDVNFTPQTCFLRITMNTVACALLRPLHPDLVIDEANGTTVKTAILQNCALDTDLMERYFATWETQEFPTMAFIGPLNSGAALLPLLPEARAREMLPRICRLMHTIAAHMPIARYVMKGWEVALWARKLEIPGPALPYFQSLEADAEGRLKDLPTSLVVARIPITQDITSDEWDDGELAFLLQKWDAMGA